jgi:hypothetical protein
MIKLTDLLQSVLPSNRIPNHYLVESKQVVKEISLNPENAFEVTYEGDGGYFTTGDTIYSFVLNELPIRFIFPGDKSKTLFVGGILDIGFTPKGDIPLTEPKGGRENLIKIYSTIYKIIQDASTSKHPQYLSISCTDSSGYFPIYSQLTKTNKIPGYSRKSIISWHHPDLGDMHSIILNRI